MDSSFTLPFFMICAVLAATQLHAEEDTRPPTASKPTQSGYSGHAQFGGPSSVSRELETADENQDSLYQLDVLQRTFTPWFDWKKKIHKDYGLKFGVNALMLYQHASEEVGESYNQDTAGGIFRFQGNWTAFQSEGGGSGKIEWRLEARSDIGGDPSPQQFGDQLTAAANTGFPYGNDFDADFGVLNWTHMLRKGRVGYAVGRLAFDAYLDSFALQSPYESFLNRSFVLNTTIATTGIGALGAAIKGHVSDNIWLGAQIYDGNAANGDFDFDTFEQHEWLTAVEIGWTPEFSRRGTDRAQLTYWHKDARREAGVSAGSGWAISSSYQITEKLLPFLRIGHSDGGAGVAAESSASLGFKYAHQPNRTWGLGGGWSKPSKETHGAGLDDEFVLETSYKLQLTRNFSFTPDVQLVFNPARSPDQDSVWIVGLRGVLTL
jgi:hypothetical protein